jgi:hypothetical protein
MKENRVKKSAKKPVRRRPTGRTPARPRTRKTPAARLNGHPGPEPVVPEIAATPPAPAASPPEVVGATPDVEQTPPESAFAARVQPVEPERPHPSSRRAIFFDVENTSRAEHIARMLEHLAVDRTSRRIDFVAVGNWRVIGHDTARLLARRGAQLVHSAPAVGIRDWSDLRIAVAAGVWLASARPGDVVEVVSDDRAFDAVGDVAASLGIEYRRVSYRALAGIAPAEPPAREVEAEPRGRSRWRGRRRGSWRERPVATPAPVPVQVEEPAPPPAAPEPAQAAAAPNGGEAPGEAHTAPHDAIVAIARELISRSPAGTTTIDALANALKSRGFRRPPGSPRLITRLRRIKELSVNRAGQITLIDSAELQISPPGEELSTAGASSALGRDGEVADAEVIDAEPVAPAASQEAVEPAAEAEVEPERRRPRRGGRRRRGPRPVPAAAAS